MRFPEKNFQKPTLRISSKFKIYFDKSHKILTSDEFILRVWKRTSQQLE